MNTTDSDTGTGTDLIGTVADWLMAQALGAVEVESLVEGCFTRLWAAGVPLWRAHISYRTIHPLFEVISMTWQRGEGIGSVGHRHGESETLERWRQSPIYHMIETQVPFLRRRLVGADALLDFPLLAELRDKGATDYLAYLVPFSSDPGNLAVRDGLAGSWATDRPSGFSDMDVRSLLRIERRLAVACKITIKDQIARNVLTAYLGPDAGRRVLEGQIRRGDGETIHAVVWYSDLRESTAMADVLAAEDFLEVLNIYFECTAGAVLAHGGEVLRFIGDAVMAIFPIGDGAARDSCERAFAAARDAADRLAKVNQDRGAAGLEALAFGLGLHVGDVMYGNIGVPERLEFSVIGRAANEVSRIEALTKTLDTQILASTEFAGNLSVPWTSLGRHDLRGVGEPVEIFAPADHPRGAG